MPALADRLNIIKMSASTMMSVKSRELAAKGVKVARAETSISSGLLAGERSGPAGNRLCR